MVPNDPIPSPCIQVCTHDADNICLGCYRSMEEIRLWPFATEAKKMEIIAIAEKRREQYDNKHHSDHHT